MYFDSHAHYDDKRYKQDRTLLLTNFPSQNVTRIINIGANMRSSYDSVALTKKYDYIYASVGIHPHSAVDITPNDLEKLEQLAKEPKVVAIGEIGLDFYYDHSPRDIQRLQFENQLSIAKKT